MGPPLRRQEDRASRERDDPRLHFRGGMRGQRTAIIARRLRQSVAFGRFAAWLSFAGAVLGQAAILAGGYFLSDDTAPHGLRNGAIAALVAIIGLVVMVLGRRAAKQAQSSTGDLGRVPLRLVSEAELRGDKQQARPAA
jgi:hypothetical protein